MTNDENSVPSNKAISNLLNSGNIRYINGFITYNSSKNKIEVANPNGFRSKYIIVPAQQGDTFQVLSSCGNIAPCAIYLGHKESLEGNNNYLGGFTPSQTYQTDLLNSIVAVAGTEKILFQSIWVVGEKEAELQVWPDTSSPNKGYSVEGYFTRYLGLRVDINYRTTVKCFPCNPGEIFYVKGYSGNAALAFSFMTKDFQQMSYFIPKFFDLWNFIVEIPEGVAYIYALSARPVGNSSNFEMEKLLEYPNSLSEFSISHPGYLYVTSANDTVIVEPEYFVGLDAIDCKLTPFISCKEGDVFYYRGFSGTSAGNCLMYDVYGNFVTAYCSRDRYNTHTLKVVIPAGVAYVIFQSVALKGEPVNLEVYKETNPWTNNPLFGKSINWLGDSYVANNGKDVKITWQYAIAAENFMTYRNYGINGNRLVGGNNSMSERYVKMELDADYVAVVGGTNDFNGQMPIDTFKTQLEEFLKNLLARYINSKVFVVCPFNDGDTAIAVGNTKTIELSEYAKAMKEVCGKLGIPFCDLFNDSGIYAWSADFQTKYFQSVGDYAHLNEAGHKRLKPFCEDFMKRL